MVILIRGPVSASPLQRLWLRPAVVVGAAVIAGCGAGSDGATLADQRKPVPRSSDEATEATSRSLGRSAHLTIGERGVTLLTMPRVGRLLASCEKTGKSSTTFVAGRNTATADVVVETGGVIADGQVDPGKRFTPRPKSIARGVQEWRVAEFAAAYVGVTTMTVAMRRLTFGGDCAISVQATITESDLGSLTG